MRMHKTQSRRHQRAARILRIAVFCSSALLLIGCPDKPSVTFTFDKGACQNVAVTSTATVTAGPPATLTVTVCINCNDSGSAVPQGGGKVTLTPKEGSYDTPGATWYIPATVRSQLGTPLTYNSATGCYEKKVDLRGVADPIGVLSGKTFTVNVTDKNGQALTSTTVTVVAK